MSTKYQGTVVSFMKAYGFIFSPELARRVFFHIADFYGPDPSANEQVAFSLGPSRTPGKPDQAIDVHPVNHEAGASALAGGAQ